MVRAFDPVVDGNILQFKYNHQNNTIVDMHKGSEWNFEGVAINGDEGGKNLFVYHTMKDFGLSGSHFILTRSYITQTGID